MVPVPVPPAVAVVIVVLSLMMMAITVVVVMAVMVTIAVMVGTSPGIASGDDLKAEQAHQQNGRRHPETPHEPDSFCSCSQINSKGSEFITARALSQQ